MKDKSQKNYFIGASAFMFILLLGAITYAFFNYTNNGSDNVVKAGRISFSTRQIRTINLVNAFPIDSSSIDNDTDNVGIVEIEIKGDTDYSEGVEYLVSVDSANLAVNGKNVPIGIDIDIDGLGTPNNNYFNNRSASTVSTYKVIANEITKANQNLVVGYIPNNSLSNQTSVDGSIIIKTFIDADRVVITDTPEELNELERDKVIFSTSEWNSFVGSDALSFNINVEAKEGIWVKENQINVRRLDFTSNNPSMTIAQLNATANKSIKLNTTVVINEGSADEQTLYAVMKLQGTSSLSYEKKNYTITFYSDETMTEKVDIDVGKNWGAQNKYCLKANWIDYTQSRNIVSARLAAQMQKKYNLFQTTPNNGVIDGFFIEVYIDGNYQGLFTMNIPKDDWMFNMDSNNPNHIVVCGENPNKGSTTSFRALTSVDKEGVDWSVEVGEANEATYTKLNRLIDFVMNSTDTDFKNNFSQYLDLDSTLNYFAFIELASATDSLGKNMLLVTYDGLVWYPSLYDLDTTWGILYDGSGTVHPQKSYVEYGGGDNLLLERIIENFPEELENRYKELRSTVLSNQNIINTFNEFYGSATNEMWQREHEKWPNIPNPVSVVSGTTGINQITTDLVYHANFADSFMDSIYIPTRTYNESNLIYSLSTPFYGAPYKYLDTGVKLYTGQDDSDSHYTIIVKYTRNTNTTNEKETLFSEVSVWHDDAVRDGIIVTDNYINNMATMNVGSDLTRNGYEALARYTVGNYSYVAVTIDGGVYRIFGLVDDINGDFGALCTPQRSDVFDACYTSPVNGRLDMRKKSNSLNDTSYMAGNLAIGSTFFMNGINMDCPYSEHSFTGVINEFYVYDRVLSNSEIRTKILSIQ